ncbi:hypothetical protein MRX96_013814 [Rhipicephalus microplus]
MTALLSHFEDFYFTSQYWDYWDVLVHSSFTTVMANVFEHHLVTICTVVLLIVAVVLGIILFYRKIKNKVDVVRARMLGTSRPRFRKRDKVLFYGPQNVEKGELPYKSSYEWEDAAKKQTNGPALCEKAAAPKEGPASNITS